MRAPSTLRRRCLLTATIALHLTIPRSHSLASLIYECSTARRRCLSTVSPATPPAAHIPRGGREERANRRVRQAPTTYQAQLLRRQLLDCRPGLVRVRRDRHYAPRSLAKPVNQLKVGAGLYTPRTMNV